MAESAWTPPFSFRPASRRRWPLVCYFAGMNNREGEVRVSVGSGFTDAVPCVPPPTWVKHEPWPPEEEQSPGACSDNGLLRVLYDCQVGLLQPGVAWHVRVVQRILSRAGAERAAHVAIEFNPAYQRLEVHCIRVWRGQQCVELARPAEFQILRRETQLERLALDGRLTATLLIPDLRIDDRLETAFTIFGENPILCGRYAGWIAFTPNSPWIETRQRLIRPVQRPLFMKAFNEPPQTRVAAHNGVEELLWSIRGQERLPVEDLLPPWSLRIPCYQITEFEHWSEISNLFEKYYRDVALPPELATELDGLASQLPNESERAVEWLRMVQKQLRYFALSLGEGGLVPRSLAEIWAKRFGDCKDAARLYVAGARYLGLDACAALVSTTSGLSIADFLPSPQVFNHVAVRLRIQGATYWLDPTMQVQGGALEQITPVYAGWVLPLTRDTIELERLPTTQPVQHIQCEDTIRFGRKVDSAAVLDRRIDFESWSANSLRNRIEGEGVSKVSAQLLQDLKRTWPEAVERSPVQVQDDFTTNRLSLLCAYEIRNCWTGADRQGRVSFGIADPFLVNELAPLEDIQRKGDILLGCPRKARWRARLQMPCEWQGNGWRHVLNDAGIQFRSELTVGRDEVVFEREVEIDAWSAAPEKAQAYAQIADKMRQNVATLWARAGFDGNIQPIAVAQQTPRKFHWPVLMFIAPGLVVLNLILHASNTDSTATSPVGTPLISTDSNLSVDRNSHSSFLLAPEAHVNRFDRIVDSPLERCIGTGRDSVGAYLQSSCGVSATVRLLRPSGGEPFEVTILPGGKSYVYFMQLNGSDTDGALAACPAADQIVEIQSGLPWTRRGTLYMCQHSLRR